MVCVSSVACVNDMLGSLEQISRGVGITDAISQSVNQLCNLLDTGNYIFYFKIFSATSKSFESHFFWNVPWKVVNRMQVFMLVRNSRWQPLQDILQNQESTFLSEATNLI